MTATRIYKEDVIFSEEAHDLRTQEKDTTYAEQIKDIWLSPWIAIYTRHTRNCATDKQTLI